MQEQKEIALDAALPLHAPIADAPAPVEALYESPDNSRLSIKLSNVLLILSLLLVGSLLVNFAQWLRRPTMIVVDRTAEGNRVTSINDVHYGQTDAVAVGPERITDADKMYLASQYVQLVYGIDPSTRGKDLEKALRMMVPDSAIKLMTYLKQQQILERQKSEKWQSVWTKQDVSVDPRDHYLVHIIGQQDITKVINNQVLTERHQLSLDVKLVADPQGRADRNMRNGVLIAGYTYKELPAQTSAGVTSTTSTTTTTEQP